MKKAILILALAALISSCMSYRSCATYAYEYREVDEQKIKTTTDWVLYLPGDTINFFPSGRRIVIVSTSVGNTKLKL